MWGDGQAPWDASRPRVAQVCALTGVVPQPARLAPEQALHEALCCRDLSEVSLRIGVTKVYETFDPLPGGHFV